MVTQKQITATEAVSVIRDGDTLYVTEAPFTQWNRVIAAITGTAASASSLTSLASE